MCLLAGWGVAIQHTTNEGSNAAHFAAGYGELDTLTALKEDFGFNLDAENIVGKTPIAYVFLSFQTNPENRFQIVQRLVAPPSTTSHPPAPPTLAPFARGKKRKNLFAGNSKDFLRISKGFLMDFF